MAGRPAEHHTPCWASMLPFERRRVLSFALVHPTDVAVLRLCTAPLRALPRLRDQPSFPEKGGWWLPVRPSRAHGVLYVRRRGTAGKERHGHQWHASLT